jgi:3',5'-cyclic AMP phosphodiesterase CpdA
MRTLVHLSDLHFGKIDRSDIEPLISRVAHIKPDVVVVSGDLTQRARTEQFIDARSFLDRLPLPQIVVPGNHDVPLYNVIGRALQPYAKYRRYISNGLEPSFVDEEIAVLGVNTARALVLKGGRINAHQITRVCELFGSLGEEITKVIVTHHPFDLPEGCDTGELVGRADKAMQSFAKCGVDLFLAGHLHISSSVSTSAQYQHRGHSAVVVQAGTATSSRVRGEFNSFNVIRIDRASIEVEHLSWRPENNSFSVSSSQLYKPSLDGWVAQSE